MTGCHEYCGALRARDQCRRNPGAGRRRSSWLEPDATWCPHIPDDRVPELTRAVLIGGFLKLPNNPAKRIYRTGDAAGLLRALLRMLGALDHERDAVLEPA